MPMLFMNKHNTHECTCGFFYSLLYVYHWTNMWKYLYWLKW